MLELCDSLSETHGTTHLRLVNLRHVDNDGLFAPVVEFCATGLGHTTDVASILDNSQLHTQANTQVGNIVRTGPVGTLNHSFRTTLAETTLRQLLDKKARYTKEIKTYGNQDTVGGAQLVPCGVILARVCSLVLFFQMRRFDPD